MSIPRKLGFTWQGIEYKHIDGFYKRNNIKVKETIKDGVNDTMVHIRHYAAICLLITLIEPAISTCLFPKQNLENGQYVYHSVQDADLEEAPEDYLLQFQCSPGFTMKGSESIVCRSSKWSDKVPSCLENKCPDPPAIPNGNYTLHSRGNNFFTNGTTATYSCAPGYELYESTDSILTCILYPDINDVQWKGATPRCIEKESCPDSGVSPDGKRSGNCCFVGDVLTFSCNDDFELVGEDKIECLPGGQWSAPRPLCKPYDYHCDLPPTIPHGVIKDGKMGDYYRPYEEVEIQCHPGYRYNGYTEFNMCEEGTGWEEEFQECVEFFCDPPEPLTNGTIPEVESSNMTVYPYNFELTYICDKGFRLIGDSWRFCDRRGWSGKSPTCETISCPDPGIPEHGLRIGNSFEIGDKVTFRCFTGYELIGSYERYCMPNGQWNNALARCDRYGNDCPDPGIPVHGMKNSSYYDMGGKIAFSCHREYTLLGSEVRECLPSREWTGEEAKCIGPYEFDNSAKISDILKKAVVEMEAKQKRNLEKYHKELFEDSKRLDKMLRIIIPERLIFYFVFDFPRSEREANLRESVEFAKAIVKKVGITKYGARAGAVISGGERFFPIEYETTEDVLVAFDRMDFQRKEMTRKPALNVIKEEIIPLTEYYFYKKGLKSIIFFLTDGKGNMGGAPQYEAQYLKEAGAEIYFLSISHSHFQRYLYIMASNPKDEHMFILQNYATLSYLAEEITNGTFDYSKCGMRLENLEKKVNLGRFAGGREATDRWPWMAALYLVRPSWQPELICIGSIIHESFILTAANCMYRINSTRRDEREIIVKLGLKNMKDQSSWQEFEVQKIIVHPDYRHRANFDYDIALLQLKKPVEFNAFVRPICLPPPELPIATDFYKPGEYAVSIGLVIEMNFLTSHSKEKILSIQSPERCRRNILERQLDRNAFNESIFCAGVGRVNDNICFEDNGGPLMQSQVNEDGYIYWTQVGIRSLGLGCRTTYGYYTNVQKSVEWVTSNIPPKNYSDFL